MFMKNLKNLVHIITSELKTSAPTLKKSHIYELISAYCNYRSYAAYQSDLSFFKITDTEIEIAKGRCFERALGLNFHAEIALLASQNISKKLDFHQQFKIQTERLSHHLYNDGEINDSTILSALKSLIDEEVSEANLLAVVICAEEVSFYQENPDNRSGAYWHNKRLAGTHLNTLQLEVADHYLSVKGYIDLLKYIKSDKSLNFPSPCTIQPISEKFSKNIIRDWTTLFVDTPQIVLEAITLIIEFDDTTPHDEYRQVLIDWLACEVVINPSRESLAELISNCPLKSEKWFWYYVGMKHDIDVTKDDYYAINADTGEEYDDYGPIGIEGYTGLNLPKVSTEMKFEVKSLAEALFRD